MERKYENFEAALDDLKRIVQSFENSNGISLDDLLKSYEQGMAAYSFCIKKLEDTQKKIKVIDSSYE
jgi:exodeoxyribonuclease VII small subunit